MKKLAIFGAALAASTLSFPAFAQNRCVVGGKAVIQDEPCGARRADSVPAVGMPEVKNNSPAAEPGPIEAGNALCREQAPKRVAWKDPSSLIMGDTMGGQMDVVDVTGTKYAARRYIVNINAKNSFGGYGGAKWLTCYTSQDGRRIIFVDSRMFEAN